MSTPPIDGLIALSTSACFIGSWPTIAVNGKTLRAVGIRTILSGRVRPRPASTSAQGLLDPFDDGALRQVVETEVLPAGPLRQVEAGVEPVPAEQRGSILDTDSRQRRA